MDPKKGMFGNGQKSCRVCGKELTEKRRIRMDINHKSGVLLAKLTYFLPLCKEHSRDEGKNAIQICIEPDDPVPMDQTMSEEQQ